MIGFVLAAEEIDVTAVSIALAASVGLILLNGFYVAYEFAVLAAKRSSFEDEPGRKRRTSVAARASLSDVSMQLAGAQLGITIASLALGRISEPALEVLIERALGTSVSAEMARFIGVSISLGLFTFLHLIFGEMVPKNIALAAPDATLRWLVIPYRLYLLVFRPVVQLLNGVANACSRLVGIQPRDELLSVHTIGELATIVTHSREEGAIEEGDAELLRGALDFAQRPVREVATAIEDYPSVDLGATAGQMERVVATTGQDRILVRGTRGHGPDGYVHARDLLRIEPERRAAPVPTGYIRRLAVVQPQQSLVEVLRLLRRVEGHLAVVTAEDGPIGVIALEEVVRAIIQPSDEMAAIAESDGGAAAESDVEARP